MEVNKTLLEGGFLNMDELGIVSLLLTTIYNDTGAADAGRVIRQS